MAISKVILNGTAQIDLTTDTVTNSAHIMNGYVGHLADGTQVTGTGQGGSSATQHALYFEFSDGTDATITAYWNDSFIGDTLLTTTPHTYGQKTVTLAQLDGVTWYEPVNIPLNTQLIDYNDVLTAYTVSANGSITSSDQ